MAQQPSLTWSGADQSNVPPPPAPPLVTPPAPAPRGGAAPAIDWSGYQEVPAQAAPAAPAPAAAAAPGGAPGAAAAAPEAAPAAAPSAGIDWGSYKDVTIPTKGVAENFARNANEVLAGAQDPSQLMDQLSQLFNDKDPRYDPTYFDHPEKAYWEMLKGVHEGMQQTWQRADQEWDAGNFTTARGLMTRADALYDWVMSGIPFAGPALSKAAAQLSAGDISGGAGTAFGILGPAAMGDFATGVYKGPAGFEAPPLAGDLRAGARNLVAQHGETAGQVIGGVGGFVKSGGEFGGAYLGYKLGGKIGRILQERAARVPDAPSVDDLASAIRQQYGSNIPVSGAAVPASIYNEIRKARPDLSDTQIRGIAEDLLGPNWRVQQAAARQARVPSPAAPPEAPPPAPEAPATPRVVVPAETAPGTPPEEPPGAPPEEPPGAPPPGVPPRKPPGAAAAPAEREQAPPEKAAAPTAKPKWKSLDDYTQETYGMKYKDLESEIGKDKAREATQPYYKTQERLKAKREGRPTGTDKADLRELGFSDKQIADMNYEQAQEALAKGVGPEEEAAPAEAANVTEQLKRSLEGLPKKFGDDNTVFPRSELEDGLRILDEVTDPSKLHAGANPVPAIAAATKIGGFYFEGGLRNFAEWSDQMLKHGEWLRPYLDQIYRGIHDESRDWKDNISTRMPTSENVPKFRGETVKLIASEDPYRNQLRINTDAILRRDPVQAGKISNAVQGNTVLKEPTALDRSQKTGELKYKTVGEFNDAHARWKQNMDNQYVGVKIDPAIANDPPAVFDSFKAQVKRNLRKLYDMVPDNVRAITSQWYDTARNEIVDQAQARGLENRQVAAVYASLSPQKDWFMNRNLATRLMDIWDNQQDARYDQTMRDKLSELTEKGKNKDLDELASGFGRKKFSEMDTEHKAAFVRLYDEAYNTDRSYHAQAPDGEDLGPVMKKGKGKNAPDVPADVAWGSLKEIGKAVSALEDGSIENIQEQLLGSHKVPNFYNNLLTPNSPAEYVTIDTHAVAAALLRALSGKSLEVAQNFGGFDSVRSGASGTYALYADAYRELARELGIQPRQLQSITWEAIRDLFPPEWKAQAKNVGKINEIWREYENDPNANFDETFDKIIKARGGEIKPGEWSAERRSAQFAEEDGEAGDAGKLH